MREHEVPTHVQTEDRVLLWFTFPQVVAMTAVCALSYGAYRYAPVGPSEVRMAVAVLLGLLGIAAAVGRIGGRRLPLVAADLLRYRFGVRLYLGPASELVRSEPPAPDRAVESPHVRVLAQMRAAARRVKRSLRGLRRLRRRRGSRERAGRRMPFRPHRWLGKRRNREDSDRNSINGNEAEGRRPRRGKPPRGLMAVAAAAALAMAVATVPQSALADGPEGDGGWRSDEIEFQPPEPVEGRRLFVEGLTVTADRAAVTLRAATKIDLRVRAFGGPQGTWLRFWGSASLDEGERVDYSLPLHGPAPSLTFSWKDTLGQAGAVTVESEQIRYPLPDVDGELCDLWVVSLGWSPGAVEGVVDSECVSRTLEPVELQTVSGHVSVTETALMDAEVTAIVGTLNAAVGASRVSVPFIPDGETRFRLDVTHGEAIHEVSIGVEMEGSLLVAMPPLTLLTFHPERTEERTETVSLWRPGVSETVSETVTVNHADGTTTEHTVTATLSIPGETVLKDVTLEIVHPERIEAEVVERDPIRGNREETLAMATGVGADEPFAVLPLPEPEPEPPSSEQTPGTDSLLRRLFELFGWEWPW